MRKYCLGLLLLGIAWRLQANETTFDFSQMPSNAAPVGCFGVLDGEGKPAMWRIITDEIPLALPSLNPNAASTAPGTVLGQVAWDSTDNHYPLLLLGTNAYGDFKVTTRFKIVDGLTEQTAGIAFRLQDERNYFYVRADALNNNFYFYRVFKGAHSRPIGNNMHFKRGVWYELSVECSGPKIQIYLDGKEALPQLSDPTFATGQIALCTKSDSITHFGDVHINFTPRESFAQQMVRDAMRENPRLLGLKIFMPAQQSPDIHLVASNNEKEIGQPGEKIDADVLARGVNYFSKDKDAETVSVTMPLRDRNGDTVASVRFVMKSFKGQTEENALIRAKPILNKLEARAASVDSLN